MKAVSDILGYRHRIVDKCFSTLYRFFGARLTALLLKLYLNAR